MRCWRGLTQILLTELLISHLGLLQRLGLAGWETEQTAPREQLLAERRGTSGQRGDDARVCILTLSSGHGENGTE